MQKRIVAKTQKLERMRIEWTPL